MYSETPIKELAAIFLEIYKSQGYSELGMAAPKSVVNKLVFLHQQQGEMFFNEQIANTLVSTARSMYNEGKVGREHFLLRQRTVLRITNFSKTGKLDFRRTTRRENHAAPAFLPLLTLFAENKTWTDSVRYHVGYIARMHFEWLTEKGIFDAAHVTHAILRTYLCHRSGQLSGCGMKACMFSLRKAYRYLFDEGYTADSFEGLLSFSVPITKKVKPALQEDEASAIFQSIDRTSAVGKRNYAVLLLAYVTGLRACDIALLKLGDIDWKIGEIHIVQKKTGHPLALPLTEDVGSALKDYILNGRPDSVVPNVFLYEKAPFYALGAKGGIRSIYESVREKAGITREAFDGKSFHAFRRTVGKNLLIAGTPLTDIAQILGQTNIESTKEYIPLDSERMKSCALGFDGIIPLPKPTTTAYSHCALDFRGIDPASCKEKIPCCALDFRDVEWKGGAQW